MNDFRSWVSGWGTSGWLVAIVVTTYALAVGFALTQGWRPTRRFVTWSVAVPAIVLTPVIVQVAASYL